MKPDLFLTFEAFGANAAPVSSGDRTNADTD